MNLEIDTDKCEELFQAVAKVFDDADVSVGEAMAVLGNAAAYCVRADSIFNLQLSLSLLVDFATKAARDNNNTLNAEIEALSNPELALAINERVH